MENTKIAGGSLLSNLQNQRYELDEISVQNDANNIEIETLNLEICEKGIDCEIDIKNYLDKPIELLIKDANEVDLNEKDYVEIKNNIIDIEFIDVLEIEEIPFDLEEVNLESIFEDINEYGNNINEDRNNINDKNIILETLKSDLDQVQDRLREREKEINRLREENQGLQKTLMREQDIVMKEQDLHDKTLSRVEQLLLDKRSELIERQKASKKNWIFKLIDKVKG
ncbi:MAG: hypothetical protein ACRCWG_12000 [Sarcina sp.]